VLAFDLNRHSPDSHRFQHKLSVTRDLSGTGEGRTGLLARRLGKASPARNAADDVDRIVSLYRDRYAWTMKHFHARAVEPLERRDLPADPQPQLYG